MQATPPEWPEPTAAAYVAAAERKATAALILAVLGVVLIPILCSLLAIVFGFQARRAMRRLPEAHGEGRALAAIYLGGAGLVFAAVALALL